MPIVSHKIEQSDDSNHVVLRMYDQDGIEYMLNWFHTSDIVIEELAAQHIAQADATLANAEFEQLIGGA